MLKITTFLLVALWMGRAEASASRTIDADAISSSDKTKTFALPSSSDTLDGVSQANTLTNKTISGASNTLTALPVAVQTVTDNFSGSSVITGTATAFTLTYAPPATTGIVATLDGLVLTIGSGNDFTISGTTLTMTTAPALGQTLKVIYSRY